MSSRQPDREQEPGPDWDWYVDWRRVQHQVRTPSREQVQVQRCGQTQKGDRVWEHVRGSVRGQVLDPVRDQVRECVLEELVDEYRTANT